MGQVNWIDLMYGYEQNQRKINEALSVGLN